MVLSEEVAVQTARYLLQIKAIRISLHKPFTWASGWKSPIYCDNRASLSFPEIRSYFQNRLAVVVKERFSEAEAIAGVATAGIAHGVLVADALKAPFAYVRAENKLHGLGARIEGLLPQGARVAVIEDLVSTGGSSLSAVEALRAAGYAVEGLCAIFSYGFPLAEERFRKSGCTFYSLSDCDHLLALAAEQKLVSPEDHELLRKWRSDPENWGT